MALHVNIIKYSISCMTVQATKQSACLWITNRSTVIAVEREAFVLFIEYVLSSGLG
jgi:hypothetical protein